MKHYYLNCEPSQRNIIKKHLQKMFESPYLIVDRLEDCNTMLIIGSKTPDMLKIEEEARHLKIQILEVNLNQLQKRSSDPVRKRDRSYSLEL
jgi:hypothetical protein